MIRAFLIGLIAGYGFGFAQWLAERQLRLLAIPRMPAAIKVAIEAELHETEAAFERVYQIDHAAARKPHVMYP